MKVPAETIDKWFDKAGAASWEEMPAEAIQKCIEYLQNQLKKVA
jgi:hypothetical protein